MAVMRNFFKNFLNIFSNYITAWIILILLLILTFATYNILDNAVYEKASTRFNFRSEEITEAIVNRMKVYEGLLNGGAALFKASNHVSREEWRQFVNTLNIDKHWPGVQAFGYSIPVKPENMEKHVNQMRSEGFPEYEIKPGGTRELYTSIIYIEPFDWRNQRAFGYDMWSNDIRREAMMRSRDYGVSATSGAITLVQETDEDIQKGFLTYIPVYENNLPLETVEQRQKAFMGWVYSAFRVNDLMNGILGTRDPNVDFEIYDSSSLSKESLLFDSNEKINIEKNGFNPDFETVKSVEVQGRPWTIHINSGKEFIPLNDKRLPVYIALGLLFIDLLLFYIFLSMHTLQKRATAIANEMTVEVKRKVEELERSNKYLEQFAYVASHDLQEPVRKMVSFSQLLDKKFGEKIEEDGKKYINFIVDGATRMQVLIQDLLKYSRVGQKKWELENFPLAQAVEDAIKNLEEIIDSNNARIIYNGLPCISAHRTYVVQLFQNLIGNAIKYRSEKTPEIIIEAENSNQFYTISVKDNGMGIDEKYLDRIFVIFERLHGSQDYEGTGIGLAICKRIIDQHGGEIWAESVGNGTTFKFTLPT